jgi:ATPase subunit of ABC transporter with duplicated ATPase domains
MPPKPTCTLLFTTGACADLWRNYNRAVAQRQQEELQQYVKRQKELASEAATAPLQQQIAGLTKLTADLQAQIDKLQKQMQADAAAAREAKQAEAPTAQAAKSTVHQQGLREGLGIRVSGTLVLIVLVLGIRRFTRNFSINKKSQAQSAS